MKILITGVTGFIGFNLAKYLKEKYNYEVFTILRENSNLTKISGLNIKYLVYKGDDNELNAFFLNNKFDGVIHLATNYLVNHTIDDIESLISSNITFGTKLIEMCNLNGIKWFINTGTLFQYTNSKSYNPFNLYSATKQAYEDILKYYINKNSTSIATLYLNDTYGPNDTRNKIFNLWDKVSNTGESLDMSPGEQLINILFIDDVINGFVNLINKLNSDNSKNYNGKKYSLLSNENISLKNLSKIFEKVSGKKLNINWGTRSYRENEIMNPHHGIELLPGWENSISLVEGIDKFLNYNK